MILNEFIKLMNQQLFINVIKDIEMLHRQNLFLLEPRDKLQSLVPVDRRLEIVLNHDS